jgi:DNA-binding NtrC family response regulator
MVRKGEFREDLWFRLNVFPVPMPPLRRRKEDIPALVRHFLEKKSRQLNLPQIPLLDSKAMDRLIDYDWPGNVRELENVIERALILSPQGPLCFDDLDRDWSEEASASGSTANDALAPLDEVVAEHIRKALRRQLGRIEGPFGAARLLGLHPSTLKGKMRKLGIRRSDFEPEKLP